MVTVTDYNRNGTIEVHRPGCADLKKHRDLTTYDVTDLRDLVLYTYPAGDFGFDADTEWTDYLGEFRLMPCCPTIPGPADAPKTSGRHPHTGCGHELTPAARATCRATHTWNGSIWAAK